MKVRIQNKMRLQSIRTLCRAPGFSKKPVHVCSYHRTSVVEAKKRIETDFLKLSLTHDAASLSFERFMVAIGEVISYIINVMRIFVGLDLSVAAY